VRAEVWSKSEWVSFIGLTSYSHRSLLTCFGVLRNKKRVIESLPYVSLHILSTDLCQKRPMKETHSLSTHTHRSLLTCFGVLRHHTRVIESLLYASLYVFAGLFLCIHTSLLTYFCVLRHYTGGIAAPSYVSFHVFTGLFLF